VETKSCSLSLIHDYIFSNSLKLKYILIDIPVSKSSLHYVSNMHKTHLFQMLKLILQQRIIIYY
jgi:hypothetical protein